MNAISRNAVDLDSARAMQIVQDQFATTPIIAVHPASAEEQSDEEELYTSFEHAISDRVMAMNKKLSRISGPLVNSQPLREVVQTDRLNPTFMSSAPGSLADFPLRGQQRCKESVWQQGILYIGLALMFVLIGFDLMGLLMLYRH